MSTIPYLNPCGLEGTECECTEKIIEKVVIPDRPKDPCLPPCPPPCVPNRCCCDTKDMNLRIAEANVNASKANQTSLAAKLTADSATLLALNAQQTANEALSKGDITAETLALINQNTLDIEALQNAQLDVSGKVNIEEVKNGATTKVRRTNSGTMLLSYYKDSSNLSMISMGTDLWLEEAQHIHIVSKEGTDFYTNSGGYINLLTHSNSSVIPGAAKLLLNDDTATLDAFDITIGRNQGASGITISSEGVDILSRLSPISLSAGSNVTIGAANDIRINSEGNTNLLSEGTITSIDNDDGVIKLRAKNTSSIQAIGVDEIVNIALTGNNDGLEINSIAIAPERSSKIGKIKNITNEFTAIAHDVNYPDHETSTLNLTGKDITLTTGDSGHGDVSINIDNVGTITAEADDFLIQKDDTPIIKVASPQAHFASAGLYLYEKLFLDQKGLNILLNNSVLKGEKQAYLTTNILKVYLPFNMTTNALTDSTIEIITYVLILTNSGYEFGTIHVGDGSTPNGWQRGTFQTESDTYTLNTVPSGYTNTSRVGDCLAWEMTL